MSVPEHARNDGHYADAYEEWVRASPASENPQWRAILTNALAKPIFFNATALAQPSVFGTQAPIPIANLFDTNQYNGTNPAVTLNQSIGLAEYTNANFVSPDTIFKNYSYPSKNTSVIIEDRNIPDVLIPGNYVQRKYYIKAADGETNNGLGYRLAGVDYFWFYRENNNQLHPDIQSIPPMDDYVYEDYAKLLLPRAVGYSAGLLNYFFRGTLEISPPDQNVYAITDGSQTPYTDTYGHQHQEFTKLKAKVRNTTPNETAGAGTLQAVAKYKMRKDYQPDLSADPTDEHPEWGVSEDDFSYSVSAPITIASLDASQSVEYAFDFSANPIPAGVTDLYLQVVFRGTIGNEADNAIAVGLKDLAEPAHQVFWNLSDQFSLGSEVTSTMVYYHLYTEDEISSTTTLRNMVDLKPTGQPNGIMNEEGEPYISPFPMTFEIAYINEANQTTTPLPVARVENLSAGRYIRLVMIQDREQPRIVRFSYSDQIDSGIIGISDQQFQEVINQTEPDGYFYYMPIDTLRHGSSGEPIRYHFYTGILRCHPKLSGDYCPYNETESIPAEISPYPAEMLFDN
jgi:hypothetical protein